MAVPVQLLLPLSSAAPRVRLVNPAMVVATVVEGPIGRLTRTLRKLRASTDPSTLNLPLEIILMIATYLDKCSLVSLSLTCQSLRGLWNSGSMTLEKVEREKLLLMLEKDIPFLQYCHYCVKLHRWHGAWSRAVSPWYEERLPCKQNIDKHLFLPNTCHIPYYFARLVMNRHLYGTKHGLPLKALKDRQSCTYEDGVAWSVAQHARISNDQLMVHSVISMAHPRGDSAALRAHIGEYGPPVCQHLTFKKRYLDTIPMQLPQLALKGGDLPSDFQACGPEFGSCTFCVTDYSIEVKWQGVKKGYCIEVLVYRGLGDCRTPFNWHWRTITTRDSGEGIRSAQSLDYGPGRIREKWKELGPS